MTDIEEGLRQIAEIRSMMERSSKFLSLSGMAGVAAGIIGLVGMWVAMELLKGAPEERLGSLVVLAFVVLGAALVASVVFTMWQARRRGLPLWTRAAQLLVFTLAIPLLAGGVFCVALLVHGAYELLPACMLLFYGTALFSASHFTHAEVRQLGYGELILGVVAALIPEWGLLLWGGGFGVLHIVYGFVMYYTRDRHAIAGES